MSLLLQRRNLDRTKQYSHLKYTLAILDIAYLLVLLFLFVGRGLSKTLEQTLLEFIPFKFLLIPAYFLVIFLVYYLLDFPLNFYRSYRLEHRFSLSRQKITDWGLDQIKSGIISYIISLILIGAFYYILKYAANIWWLIISIFWIFFSIILAKLLPVIIIPLFFKYKRLSDETLRSRIMSLAEKMKVKILDVFEIDFSKKTLKANAAFVGVGNTRRVILADTLKDKYSHDEIEVILAHEFAHYKLKHLLKLIFVNSSVAILIFYVIFRTSPYTLEFFGLSTLSELGALPVILIYFILCGVILQPVENYISRNFERHADMLALEITGLKDAFISMMEKLASQNLADRCVHPVIKFFFFDHPPVDERIEMARSSKYQ
jgi:STE24 endopeptidase